MISMKIENCDPIRILLSYGDPIYSIPHLVYCSPGSSELDEQWSGPFQVNLIDWVVFVRVFVVSTATGTEPLPLTIDLKTEIKSVNIISTIPNCLDKVNIFTEYS